MQSRAKRSTIFHQLGIGVPARSALVRALLVLGFGGLNEPEPHRLSALGTRPKCERLRRSIPKRFWHLHLGRGIRTSRRQRKCRDTKKLLFLKVSVLALHDLAQIFAVCDRFARCALGKNVPSGSGSPCGPPHMMKSSVQSVGLALRYVHGDCFAVSMVLITPFFSTRSASLDQSWAILRRAIFRPASKVPWALSTQ